MIDSSKKHKHQLGFELQNSHVYEKRSKLRLSWVLILYNPNYGKTRYERDWICSVIVENYYFCCLRKFGHSGSSLVLHIHVGVLLGL